MELVGKERDKKVNTNSGTSIEGPPWGQGVLSVPLIEANRYKDYTSVNFAGTKVYVSSMEVSQSRGSTTYVLLRNGYFYSHLIGWHVSRRNYSALSCCVV